MIPKLEVQDLSYSYHSMDGETKALSNISFSVYAGEFLAVVGPSGCGKSTLLSLICGLLKASEGSVLIDGKPMETGDSRIGYMLQKDHLFEWRTIFSNACLGLEIQRNLDEEGRERVRRLLETYGLEDFADARPSELSGGMRQRAALIRTLALEPDILLLDEPFSALDYQTRLAVCDDISTIIREQKKTAILVTHDLSEAVSAADRILILTKRPGRVKDTITIKFPDNAGSPLLRRNCPEFSSYFNEVWKVLREGGAS
ncbi:MAG: ABC transporter ATP-binding protein [Lachnospiraceae bacterium]|nr:ABC transporter ATP-binding protein [Lachnospiraceae bacterium]MBQ5868090.1 ABC transporter ATP-binding protein [Lachnospiraceae bacterium]